MVDALLRHFNREPYHHTLEPPPVGSDIVDDFLFQTRSGFCAHYAGAMTFVLRAAGIPARVVAGYRGGEVNPAGNYLSVHQFDAHAWSNTGSPSAAGSVSTRLSVSRPSASSRTGTSLGAERSFLADEPLSLLRFRDVGWMNTLRLRWDSLNYGWQRWVLTIRMSSSRRCCSAGLQARRPGARSGPAAVLGLLTGILALVLFKPRRREKMFSSASSIASSACWHARYPPPQRRGARSFAERAATEMPDQAPAIRAFVRLYEAQRYAQLPGPGEELSRALTNVRRAMPRRIAAPRRHS